MRALRLALVLLLIVVGVPTSAQQITTGRLTGAVTDSQGLAVAAARVTLTNEDTADVRETLSNTAGLFVLAALPPGQYRLTVAAEGFEASTRTGIRLRANETYDAGSFALSIHTFAASESVTADLAVIQTATADRSAVIESEQMNALLARGRDPVALLATLPGVAPVGDVTSLGGQFGPLTPNIMGQRSASAGLAVDGMAAADGDNGRLLSPVSIDVIDQIDVALHNYAAEYGRNAGAQVNIVTKAGTRRFSGSVAYFVRNEALNANNFFNIRNGLERPLYRYNTVVGTLGGPVILPRAKWRDRLFFFYVREMWDAKEPRPPRFATMPTALERAGDFSQSFDQNGRLIPVTDPQTGRPFPGNRVPAERIDPLGRALVSLLPLPNFFDVGVSRGAYNYRDQDLATVEKTLDQLRIDANLSQRDRLWMRWRRWRPLTAAYSGLAATTSNWNHFRHGYAVREDSFQATYTRMLGPSLVNELSTSYRYITEVGPAVGPLDPVRRGEVGLSALPQLYPGANAAQIVPALTFGGVPGTPPTVGFDGRFPIDGGDGRTAIANNISWARQRHLVKAGGYLEFNQNSEGPGPIASCFTGCFNFGADANNPLNSGYAFANALLGHFTSYQEATARPLSAGRTHFVEWFIQDSWKARSDLTIDAGLRFAWGIPWRLRDGQAGAAFVPDAWDPARQPRLFRPALVDGRRVGLDEATGRVVPAALIGALVPGSGDPYNGIVTQADAFGRAGWRQTPPVQPQPRIGFAWSPGARGKTAIRGGFAVTTQVLQDSGDFSLRIPSSPPIRLQPTIFYGTIAALDASQGFLFPFDAVPAYSSEYRPPRTRHFFVEVQRDIGFETVMSVAFVGNRQRNLTQSRNLNALPAGVRFDPRNADPTNPSRPLPDAFLTPIRGYGVIRNIENTGFADYDSLQVTATRRFKRGLQYAAAYTLSRARNLTDGDAGTLPTYHDPQTFLYDYAGYDRRHVLTFNYVWDLPRGSAMWNTRVTRALLDNWQVAGVTLFASGPPAEVTFTTTDNADIVGGLCVAGSANCGDANRVVVTGDPRLAQPTFERWFDTSAFRRPARGDEGNARRHPVRLPGRHNWDVSVAKMITGRPGRGIQVRAEFYNLFNINQWTAVDTVARFDAQGNQVNPRFGQVTAAADPRIIQLSLRATF